MSIYVEQPNTKKKRSGSFRGSFKAPKNDAVKRATHRYPKPPHEKDLQKLVDQTFEGEPAVQLLVDKIQKRITKNNWVVAMKSLIVVYRLIDKGDAQFLQVHKRKPSLFQISHFKPVDGVNRHLIQFLNHFGKALTERLNAYSVLGYLVEKNESEILSLNFKQLSSIITLQRMQTQLNTLLNCKIHKVPREVRTPLTNAAMLTVLTNTLKLYSLLSKIIPKMLKAFWEAPYKEAYKMFEIYTLYVRETAMVMLLCQFAEEFLKSSFPKITDADDQKMREVMQKRLQDIKSDNDYVPQEELKGLGHLNDGDSYSDEEVTSRVSGVYNRRYSIDGSPPESNAATPTQARNQSIKVLQKKEESSDSVSDDSDDSDQMSQLFLNDLNALTFNVPTFSMLNLNSGGNPFATNLNATPSYPSSPSPLLGNALPAYQSSPVVGYQSSPSVQSNPFNTTATPSGALPNPFASNATSPTKPLSSSLPASGHGGNPFSTPSPSPNHSAPSSLNSSGYVNPFFTNNPSGQNSPSPFHNTHAATGPSQPNPFATNPYSTPTSVGNPSPLPYNNPFFTAK